MIVVRGQDVPRLRDPASAGSVGGDPRPIPTNRAALSQYEAGAALQVVQIAAIAIRTPVEKVLRFII